MISINIFEIVMQIINFLILLWLLNKLLYQPLLKYLAKRETEIRENYEKAETNKKATENIFNHQKKLFEEAHLVAKKLRESVTQTLEKERETLINEAKVEAANILKNSKKEIELEYKKIKQELIKDVGTLSLNLAQKILQKELNSEEQEHVVQAYLKTLNN